MVSLEPQHSNASSSVSTDDAISSQTPMGDYEDEDSKHNQVDDTEQSASSEIESLEQLSSEESLEMSRQAAGVYMSTFLNTSEVESMGHLSESDESQSVTGSTFDYSMGSATKIIGQEARGTIQNVTTAGNTVSQAANVDSASQAVASQIMEGVGKIIVKEDPQVEATPIADKSTVQVIALRNETESEMEKIKSEDGKSESAGGETVTTVKKPNDDVEEGSAGGSEVSETSDPSTDDQKIKAYLSQTGGTVSNFSSTSPVTTGEAVTYNQTSKECFETNSELRRVV